MNISELKAGQGNVDLEADVIEVSEARTFNKNGRDLKVATATLKDDSGTVKLSLWNQDVDKVKAGDRIKINKGYTGEFQGEKQLTAGKMGNIEVIGKAENLPEKTPVKAEEAQQELEGVTEDKIEDSEEEF